MFFSFVRDPQIMQKQAHHHSRARHNEIGQEKRTSFNDLVIYFSCVTNFWNVHISKIVSCDHRGRECRLQNFTTRRSHRNGAEFCGLARRLHFETLAGSRLLQPSPEVGEDGGEQDESSYQPTLPDNVCKVSSPLLQLLCHIFIDRIDEISRFFGI